MSLRQMLLLSAAGVLAFGGHGFAQSGRGLPEVVVTQPKAKPKPKRQAEPAARPRPPEGAERPTAPARTARPRVPAATPPAATPEPSAPAAGPQYNEPVTTALQGVPATVQQTSTGPATIVTQSQLARTSAAQLGDALFTRPGVTSTTYAPGASFPVIRGLDSLRVRVQENGIGAQDATDLGQDHGVPIDPLAADKVEIIRGPGTLRFSSQAIGGIAAASSERIPEILPAQGLHGEIRGAHTTVDRGYDGIGVINGAAGNTAFHFDAFGRQASDYAIPTGVQPFPNGVQPNTALRANGEAAGVSRFFDGGFHGIGVQRYQSLYRIPGVAAAAENKRIDLDQTKVAARGAWRTDGGFFEGFRYWAGASNYQHKEIGLGEDVPVDIVHIRFVNREQEGRFEAAHVPIPTAFGLLTGVMGFDAGHRNLGSFSDHEEVLIKPARVDRGGLYAFEQLRFAPTWALLAAFRIDRSRLAGVSTVFPGLLPPQPEDPEADPIDPELTNNALARSFTPKSVSVALVKELPWGVVATLTGERKQRAPAPLELFARGAHEALGTFEIGNANLTMETMNAAELGFRRWVGDFRFEANAYYRYFNDFITRLFTGNTCGEDFATCIAGPGEEFQQVVYAQQDAIFRGVEVLSQLDLVPLFDGVVGVDGQYDYVRATFTDGTNVPRMPPMRAGGGVYWRNANWFTRVGLIHAFAQNHPGVNETPTPGYDLLRAELSYTHRTAGPGSPLDTFTFGVVGTNLLDDVVRNSVSFVKDEVVLPGRSVRLFATARF